MVLNFFACAEEHACLKFTFNHTLSTVLHKKLLEKSLFFQMTLKHGEIRNSNKMR